MKIALFSDIHANLPAFKAMLADMDNQKPDVAYCLGDLVGYHVWPNEVIDELRNRGIMTVKGNHDEKVEELTTTSESLNEPGKHYAYHIINKDNRNFLKTLPVHIKLEFTFNQKKLNLVFAHGSTRSINEYIFFDTEENYVLELMEESNADILFIGHSHKPYHRVLKTKDGSFKHIVNLGSVGKPKDNDTRGCYVILTLDEENLRSTVENVFIDFRRVAYDVETSARAIEASPLPNEFAQALRIAK